MGINLNIIITSERDRNGDIYDASAGPDYREETALDEAIRTYEIDRALRSYRKVGKEVHADHNTVKYRINLVNEGLKDGELVYIDGKICRNPNR